MFSDASGERTAILNGRYRLERVLGEGAFGRVYVAYDTRLQRTVAIKELLATKTATDPRVFAQYLERFEREARAAGSIFHANIVNVFELAIGADNNYYLIMEFVERGNLRDLLQRVKTLPIERALEITLDIARALEAIHEKDIVHRDLKPANIMLTDRGVAKVADFGVAQLSHESQRTQISSRHPGTPLYMSPEQQRNTAYLDGRSDLYSLGLILYEMLAGEPYARRQQPLEALRPDLPGGIRRIFTRLTEPERDRRYLSAEEVVADLQAVLASESRGTGTGTSLPADTVVDDHLPAMRTVLDSPVVPTTEPRSAAATPLSDTGAAQSNGTGAVCASATPYLAASIPATPARLRVPKVLGIVGGLAVVLAVIGGLLLTRGGVRITGQQTAIPAGGVGTTREASVPPTTPPVVSPTTLVSAVLSPTPSATGTPTPVPTNTPTALPTVRPRATTRPDFQPVTNQKYAISFAYPKAWQRSDDETDQDTIYAFRLSPSAAFLVAKEDNPTATSLEAYIDDEIKLVTAQHSNWKLGSRAHQPTMLGGQPAQIVDFLVPTTTGQGYHYYVFTMRPKQAWGLLFFMPLNDFGTYQKDIADVVQSFAFCTGDDCPTQSAQPPALANMWDVQQPAHILVGFLPRRRTTP